MLACAALMALAGCTKSASSKTSDKKSPAKIEAHPDEDGISLVTLTPKAVERLGITTEAARIETVERRRTLGGEVLVPDGNIVTVSAPVSGTLGLPADREIPPPGTRLHAGQPVFSFVPLLSPERDVPTPVERVQIADARASLLSAQIIADGDVRQSRAEVEAAQIMLDRAEQLLADKVGSERDLDAARATLTIAQRKLEAAEARKETLDELTLDAKPGELRLIQLTSPQDGILQRLNATRGQMVTTGTPLFDVVNLDQVWIRVPIYAGQVEDVDLTAHAAVGRPGADQSQDALQAEPIAAPPSANAIAATIDLYYRLDNPGGRLRPGERVSVSLALNEQRENLVIPWAAILSDIHGVDWVYARTEPTVFRRRRVMVAYSVSRDDGDLAVLTEGLEEGTEVVVDGAAELFGTEFGAGK